MRAGAGRTQAPSRGTCGFRNTIFGRHHESKCKRIGITEASISTQICAIDLIHARIPFLTG